MTAAKIRALAPDYFTDELFVSTEDPETVAYFVNKTDWRTGYTDGVPRKPDRWGWARGEPCSARSYAGPGVMAPGRC